VSLSNAGEVLRDAGFWQEASAIEDDGIINWALEQVGERRAMTVNDEAYPARWLTALGSGAPPALWIRGGMGAWGGLSIVGSRILDEGAAEFARSCGAAAVGLGLAVVSGGAPGADSEAAQGALACGEAARVVEILPRGILGASDHGAVSLAVGEPWADFSSALAMERNALIYAFSPFAVVVQARYKEGGTWHGAADALRRRLCTVLVRDDGSDAARALAALGGVMFRSPGDLAALCEEEPPPPQLELFGYRRVRESRLAWVA
jgi:predicted Rossmann fold nucleotide-binding protein DprA/Smf involved in DNA uptake